MCLHTGSTVRAPSTASLATSASTIGPLVQFLVSISGSARNFVSVLAAYIGVEFWSAAGALFCTILRKSAVNRVARIAARSLTAVTPWVEDWDTIPLPLRAFVTHAVSGEWEQRGRLSTSGEQQKFRNRFMLMMLLYKAVNAKCVEPLHTALERGAYYGGNTWGFRMILARLLVLFSDTTGYQNRIYEGLEQEKVNLAKVLSKLVDGFYIAMGQDNADFKVGGDRLKVYQHSGVDLDVHILTRMVRPNTQLASDPWSIAEAHHTVHACAPRRRFSSWPAPRLGQIRRVLRRSSTRYRTNFGCARKSLSPGQWRSVRARPEHGICGCAAMCAPTWRSTHQ